MAIGTGALGQYAIGQSETQPLAILPALLVNTTVFHASDLGLQAIVAPLLTNTSVIYQRAAVWAVRARDSEIWIERTQQPETWTRVA